MSKALEAAEMKMFKLLEVEAKNDKEAIQVADDLVKVMEEIVLTQEKEKTETETKSKKNKKLFTRN